MKRVLKGLLVVGVVCLAMPAFAKGKAKMHCTKDGADVTDATTKKACKKAGGKWEKMTAAPAGDTAAPTPPPATP